MSPDRDIRKEAILAIIDQLEVPEHQEGDIELLRTLVLGQSIEDYVRKLYIPEPEPKEESEFVNIRPVDADKK